MAKIDLAFLKKGRDACQTEIKRLRELFLEQTNPEHKEKNSHGIHNENCDMQITEKLLNRRILLLQAWNEAIIRMAQNKYGTCLGCGKTIPMKRLQAKPYATFCMECLNSTPKS